MTPQEFKAWFDGFTEALGDQPTKTQWERIKTRVAQVEFSPPSETAGDSSHPTPRYNHPEGFASH